jgi:hypothetical protein
MPAHCMLYFKAFCSWYLMCTASTTYRQDVVKHQRLNMHPTSQMLATKRFHTNDALRCTPSEQKASWFGQHQATLKALVLLLSRGPSSRHHVCLGVASLLVRCRGQLVKLAWPSCALPCQVHKSCLGESCANCTTEHRLCEQCKLFRSP